MALPCGGHEGCRDWLPGADQGMRVCMCVDEARSSPANPEPKTKPGLESEVLGHSPMEPPILRRAEMAHPAGVPRQGRDPEPRWGVTKQETRSNLGPIEREQ